MRSKTILYSLWEPEDAENDKSLGQVKSRDLGSLYKITRQAFKKIRAERILKLEKEKILYFRRIIYVMKEGNKKNQGKLTDNSGNKEIEMMITDP